MTRLVFTPAGLESMEYRQASSAPEARPNPRSLLVLLTPFAAVGIGLYLLESAWAAILLYHAGMAGYLAIARPAGLLRHLSSGWRNPMGLALCIVCATCGLMLVLLWPIVAIESRTLAATLARFGLHGPAWWSFILYYATLHPVLEEAFWRGSNLARGRTRGLTDAAFGAYHFLVLIFFVRIEWALITVGLLTATAWLWRRIANRNGGLAIPILSHAVADLSTMAAAAFLANSHPTV